MNDYAIKVEGLSKLYRIGKAQKRHDTLRDALVDSFRHFNVRTFQQSNDVEATIWALKDISFEVQPGEILGIIGRNGAGKTTLLKILSRVTEPTTGRAVINGRVGSLLEVGTGFHPELTGRENIYLNGAILGMTHQEIDQKFDEIVDFSEIEKFLDTPVKRYSSGMYVRLAFAVAAHLEPEILLVDEVLAVGDAAFQKKCLGKMSDVARGGRTILFVSHNMVAVQSLCTQAVWIDEGRIKSHGNVKQVVEQYMQSSFSDLTEQYWHNINDAPGNEKVRLKRLSIGAEANVINGIIDMQTPLIIEILFWNLLPGSTLNITLHILDEHGITAFSTYPSRDLIYGLGSLPDGLVRTVCHIPGNLLNAGVYRIAVLVVQDTSKVIYRYDDALMFEVCDVADRHDGWLGREPGSIHPILDWEMELL